MDGLACYQDAASLLVEMRRLAIIAGATELDDPLTRLAAHCRDACDPPTELCLLVGIVSLPISAADGQDGAVAASESTQAPTVRLDSVAPWPNAAVADPRILTTAESPWDLVRAVCHVVKARWLIDYCRRTPGSAPRCEVSTLLAAHDESQRLLVDRGWLPAATISKGSSCAKLAQTFPEEMCPCYGD